VRIGEEKCSYFRRCIQVRRLSGGDKSGMVDGSNGSKSVFGDHNISDISMRQQKEPVGRRSFTNFFQTYIVGRRESDKVAFYS